MDTTLAHELDSSDSHVASPTLTERLATYFHKHPGVWLTARSLSRIGGHCGWRSRISDLRRTPYLMTIENRQRRVTLDDGRPIIVSEYCFVPADRCRQRHA